MATRGQINIVENGCLRYRIYHHYDSYPEYPGVGYELMKTFAKNIDTYDTDTIKNILLNQLPYYELTDCNHADIEYLYIIDTCKHTIRCFATDLIYNMRSTDNNLKVIEEISLQDKYLHGIVQEQNDYKEQQAIKL